MENDDQKKNDFALLVEKRARALVEDRSNEEDAIVTALLDEIHLTLHHLQQSKIMFGELHRKLVQDEARIGTQILRLRNRSFLNGGSSQPERLHSRLSSVQREGRALAVREQEYLQSLTLRLLQLVNKHRQLS